MAQVTGNSSTNTAATAQQYAAKYNAAYQNSNRGRGASTPPKPKVPAWLNGSGNQPSWLQSDLPDRPTGSFFSGGGQPRFNQANRPPAWLAFNQPYNSPLNGPMDIAQPPDPNGPMPYIPQSQQPQWQPPQQNRPQLPAWLQQSQAPQGWLQPKPKNKHANAASQGGNPNATPTGSVLSGGGEYVMGPSGQAVPMITQTQTPTGSMLAANGTVAQGPQFNFPQMDPMADQPNSGYGYGFGSRYRGWGGGRGGGGGGGYSNLPAWFLGLNSWSFNE